MNRFVFRDWPAYRLALDTAVRISRIAARARPEAWAISRQGVRAANSIALNIAEGAGEYSSGEKARFYRIAKRSAWETVAALDLMEALSTISSADAETLRNSLDQLAAMLTGLIRAQADVSLISRKRQKARRAPQE